MCLFGNKYKIAYAYFVACVQSGHKQLLCSLEVFAQIADVSPDVVRGWVETHTVPTVKVGRRRLVNLFQLRKDLEQGKTIFCQGDYDA